jgi:hypothetical protein
MENIAKVQCAQKRKTSKSISYKPFNKLLEDVTFNISGYKNPRRTELRNKATAMGACFYIDVDITHLM